ncbi:hypothetical protein CEXT_294301 [Caerostris extrusa]|uniref:Uncharacterized protein n=1 Tax=Caerostris extrusa TaxID=172846 RepID=A0AAV4U8Z4_CAEEX|nr:hypothetical protein CEXT_294301 [Caerostris extrusa]
MPPLGGSVSTARSVFWGLRDFQLWPPNFETDVEKEGLIGRLYRASITTRNLYSINNRHSVCLQKAKSTEIRPLYADNLPSAFLLCTKPLADIVCLASPLYYPKRELINMAQRGFFPLPLLIARSNRDACCRRGGLTFLICSPESVAASSAAPLPMPPLGGSVSTARSVFWGLRDFQLWPPNFETDVWEKRVNRETL